MSKDEINVFEKVWKMIWEYLYKIIAWLSGKGIDKDGDGTTECQVPDMSGIAPIY